MKIAITGTTGFIGSYLVKYFSKQNISVIAFGRKQSTDLFIGLDNVKYITWDITNKDHLTSLRNLNSDIFIHCAANLDYTKTTEELLKDNVDSLQNVQSVSQNSKRFIYISSSSVYQGKSPILKTTDNIDITDLQNSYSLTKYLAEQYIRDNFKNTEITILRPRAVYGKGDRVLVPEILKNQFLGRLLLPGTGSNKTSISEISQFIEFIGIKSIEPSVSGISMCNFSSDIQTYDDLYNQIVKEYNLRGVIHIPLFIFKILCFFNKNSYSYIVDTFGNDKILQ